MMLTKIIAFMLGVIDQDLRPAIEGLLGAMMPDMPPEVRRDIAQRVNAIAAVQHDSETLWFELNGALADYYDHIPEVLR
jgi:hypothetical protein